MQTYSRDVDTVLVSKVNEFPQWLLLEEREGTTSELETINVGTHPALVRSNPILLEYSVLRFEHIGQVALAHHLCNISTYPFFRYGHTYRVVRASDLGNTLAPGLRRTRVGPSKAEAILILQESGILLGGRAAGEGSGRGGRGSDLRGLTRGQAKEILRSELSWKHCADIN